MLFLYKNIPNKYKYTDSTLNSIRPANESINSCTISSVQRSQSVQINYTVVSTFIDIFLPLNFMFTYANKLYFIETCRDIVMLTLKHMRHIGISGSLVIVKCRHVVIIRCKATGNTHSTYHFHVIFRLFMLLYFQLFFHFVFIQFQLEHMNKQFCFLCMKFLPCASFFFCN